MNSSKYNDGDYLFYYVDKILWSGHVQRVIKFDTISMDTFMYTLQRFSKAGGFDSVIEDDLLTPEFIEHIKELDI